MKWLKWLDSTADSTDMSFRKLQEIAKDREVWRAAVHGVTNSHDLATEEQHKPYAIPRPWTR